MAETPRDKRDDRDIEFEQFQKWQQEDRENPAIKEFKEKKRQALASIIYESHTLDEQIKNLSEHFNGLSKDDSEYEAVKAQLKELKASSKGLEIQRAKMIEELGQAGQESVIADAEMLAADKAILANIERKSALVKELKAKKEAATDPFEIERLEKEIAEAEKEAEDPQLLNSKKYKIKKGSDVKSTVEGIASVKGMPNWAGDVAKVFSGEFKSNMGDFADKISNKVHGPLGILINITGKIFDVAVAMRRSVDGWVDEAANVLAANVGRISAALEGTGQTYQTVTESAVESLGLSRFVKQTDYISKIAELTSRGITYNVEQRAILETIKDKTIASFSSMDASLLRLVKLRQQDLTATQFGLEAALRNTLNRVFKDSTYLQDMYDGISNAITDAVIISGAADVTEYSSVIQTWMGAMYESGVESGMVNKIANALNALGSGNVSALASDQDIQRLILLSMDTIGMDYADILQQGLSSSDINDLLNAVVDYLVKIESNTKDNNVLASSYTNLFGMTMADLQAFKNLDAKTGSLTAVNQGSALGVVSNEISKLQSTERTIVAEQIQNVFDNAKFTFGSSIAKDTSSYITWKVSNLMLDVANQVVNSPTAGKHPLRTMVAKVVGAAAESVIFANELKGILSIARALPSLFAGENTGLQTLINGAPTYGDSTSISATMTSAGSNFKSVNTMSKITSNSEYQTAYSDYSSAEWGNEEEESDPILEKLGELDKLKTQNEAGQQAWAVFLTGMTDDTLRSFASIFADEDAMNDTFTGENNVLKDNLFEYIEDTTSNSTTTSTTE